MKTEIIAADALRRAIAWVRGQVRRDRENRYSLLRDWRLPAAETQLRTIVWLLRTILATTLSNLIGLLFLYLRSR